MICTDCARAAQESREDFDEGATYFTAHPESCGCPCQHRVPQQWAKMYSSERPNGS